MKLLLYNKILVAQQRFARTLLQPVAPPSLTSSPLLLISYPVSHWERFGFRDDPYYGIHLPVAPLSVELFVGREEDRARLTQYVAAYPTGKTMVQGPPGVGKTSLVNVVQQELFAASERLPLLDLVEVPADATRESFLLAVLSALVSTLRTVLGEEQIRETRAFRDSQAAVTRTLQHAASLNLQASVPGVAGAGLTRAPMATTPLATTAQTLIDLLRAAVTAVSERGFQGLIVPVNNLDTLPDGTVIAFLNSVRDVCSAVDGVHWTFIGGAGLFEKLEQSARRLSEHFTSNPISLAPLEWTDVKVALERRRTAFAMSADAELPISERVARMVYDAGGGELRFTFTRLSRTVLDFSVLFPSERRIPDELALQMLRDWGERHLVRQRLTPQEARVLEALRASGALRARGHAALGIGTSQQLSRLLRDLSEKGYLRRVPLQGGSEYRLSAAAALAYGPAVGPRESAVGDRESGKLD